MRLTQEIGQWARVTAPAVEVHCISDLHCDYKPNLEWTEALPLPEKNAAGGSRALRVLLLAGDLATDLAILERCLVGLKMRYDEVVFVPGNHEAWVSRGAEGGQAPDSFAKLGEVLAVCARCGVRTAPLTVELPHSAGASGRVHEVLLLPLLSWYHASWDTEPELPEHETRRLAFEGARPFEQRWADFKFCKWPGISSNWTSLDAAAAGASEALSERFAAVNARWVAEVAAGADGVEREVISFSHFVPRQELLPEKRFLITPELPKVVGSRPLEAQIRAAGATLHCFGHTHLPVDMTLEGVRYIQWSLGMQREAKDGRACAVVKREGPTLVWDSADGAGPYRPTMWGDYYRSNTRNPSETALAPWVLDHAAKARRRMAKLRGEREESESAQGRVEGGGGSHLLRLVRRAWRAVARRRAEEGADEVEAPARDGTPPSRDGRGGETLEQIRVRHYGRER